jgi:hypothetical protein
MSDQEINHFIATQVNLWIHDEGIFYHDAAGFTCYLADYCHSLNHAMDLAKANNIALKPVAEGWSAYKLNNETAVALDALASKAICLCLLNTTELA